MGATLSNNQFLVFGHLCTKLPEGGFSVDAYNIVFNEEKDLVDWLREHVEKEMHELWGEPIKRTPIGKKGSTVIAGLTRARPEEEENFGAIDEAFALTRKHLFG